MRVSIVLSCLLFSTSAFAIEGQLVGEINGHPGAIIWKTEEDLLDGEAVIEAKAQSLVSDALNSGIACFAGLPQRAITADTSKPIIRVILVGGKEAGCRGLIRRSQFEAKE